jgi:AraC-like DNA-binding protein
MDIEKLVERYIDAWNRQDIAGILELIHSGAAFYDAFWMETCVGKDLPRYLQDSLEEESHCYQRIGEVIPVDDGVVFRYSAHEQSGPTIGPVVYYGAEVLIVLDNKILTVSDYYCNPDRTALEEVAELAAKRHGLASHTKSGLGAMKALRIKAALSTAIEHDKTYRDSSLTLSRLAEKIGCPVDYLSQVIDDEFGADFDAFLINHRIRYARELLQEKPDDPSHVKYVASKAGFESLEEFYEAFSSFFGTTVEEFRRRDEKTDGSVDDPHLH